MKKVKVISNKVSLAMVRACIDPKELAIRANISYQNNPIVQTVKKLLEQHPEGWSGTSSELLDAGKVLLTAYIAATPRELTGKLTPLDKPLFDYDGIIHTRAKRGTGGGRHHFYYASTDKYEQTVFPPI